MGVTISSKQLVILLKSLADPTRLRLLHLLAHRGPEICVCDLVDILGLPQSTISRHIGPLRLLGLVQGRRQGTWIHYHLAEPTTPLLARLRELLRACGGEAADLADDLSHYDRLLAGRALVCCKIRPSEPTSREPFIENPAPAIPSGTIGVGLKSTRTEETHS